MSVQWRPREAWGLAQSAQAPRSWCGRRQVVKGLRPCGQSTWGLAGHLAEALAAQGPAVGLELLEEKQQVVSHSLEAIELGAGLSTRCVLRGDCLQGCGSGLGASAQG